MRTAPATKRRMAALGIVVLLAAAACGDDDDPPATTGSETSTTVAITTTQATIPTTSVVTTTTPGTTAVTTTNPTTTTPTTTTPTTAATTTSTAPPTTTISCSPELQRGCETETVRTLQTLLNDAGFGGLGTDGIFGPQTEQALVAFESSCAACTADGRIIVDGPEWVELEATEPEIDYAAGFSSFIGGGLQDSCQDFAFDDSFPTFGFGSDLLDIDVTARLILGYDYDVCFVGFDPDDEITVTVDGPSGVRTLTATSIFADEGTVRALFDPDGSDELLLDDLWFSARDRLDDPSLPGEYLITATQGDLSATRTVVIATGEQPIAERRIIPIDDDDWTSARPGDPLRMILIGFPPGSEVPLAVYRNTTTDDLDESADFELVTPIESATVGSQGWAYHDFLLPALEASVETFPDYCIATTAELREPSCRPWDPVVDVQG